MTNIRKVSSSVILLFCFINCAFSQSCSSPTTCTSIYNCPSILSTIQDQQTISPARAAELRRLACTSAPGRYPYICCPPDAPTVPTVSNGQGNVLPSRGQCGIESFGKKIFGGESTGLDEFPWMALFEYAKRNNPARTINCAGVLINQRYVLTAAHCLVGEIRRRFGDLVNIRLGEYDIVNTTDCVDGDCADPIRNVGIEETVAHPGFNDRSRNKTNDIGVVRLAEDVAYTDFIKPICVPWSVGATRSEAATVLQVAGWGRTLTSQRSNTKQKLELTIFDHALCQEKFLTVNAFLDDSQLCAGGVKGEDACAGDSGGPLMKFSNNYWVVEGIVSFGRSCGLEGWPGVYTRVSSFEDWITSSMRP